MGGATLLVFIEIEGGCSVCPDMLVGRAEELSLRRGVVDLLARVSPVGLNAEVVAV